LSGFVSDQIYIQIVAAFPEGWMSSGREVMLEQSSETVQYFTHMLPDSSERDEEEKEAMEQGLICFDWIPLCSFLCELYNCTPSPWRNEMSNNLVCELRIYWMGSFF